VGFGVLREAARLRRPVGEVDVVGVEKVDDRRAVDIAEHEKVRVRRQHLPGVLVGTATLHSFRGCNRSHPWKPGRAISSARTAFPQL